MSRLSPWLPKFLSRRRPMPRRPLARLQLLSLEDRAVPATFTVTSLADSGANTLRQALIDANSNGTGLDTVAFNIPAGGTIVLASEISVSGSVFIDGPSAFNITVSGNNVTRMFNINNGSALIDVTIDQLTLTKGNATVAGSGGAILNSGGENLTIQNSQINNSSAKFGGAFTMSGGTLTVSNSAFSGNTATAGNGGAIDGGFNGTITDSGITNNSASGSGGAFGFSAVATLQFTNVTITGNSASQAGGLYLNGPTATFNGCTISSNKATVNFGGAIYANSGATVNLIDSTLNTNSTATNGGAIYNNATVTLTRTNVTNNTAASNGGGIHSLAARSVTITDSTFTGNKATSGGGGGVAMFAGGGLKVTGSNFSGNFATNSSGGAIGFSAAPNALGFAIVNTTIANNTATYGAALSIGVASGTLNLFNSTLTGNSASQAGGIDTYMTTATVNIESTIISGNTASTFVSVTDVNSGSGTFNLKNSAVGLIGGFVNQGGNITGQPHANLKLGSLGSYGGLTQTIPLLAGSPAINAGSNPSALSTDARALARVNGTAADMGAFERQMVVSITADSGNGSLRNAVADSNVIPGLDIVTFDSSFNTAKTIALASGLNTPFAAGGMTIQGPGAGLLTISGNSTFRLFDLTAGGPAQIFTFNDLTLSGGSTGGDGGAIACNDEILVVNNSVLSGNSAGDEGGAIYQGTGSVTLTNTTLSGNTALSGGAVYLRSSSTNIQSSTFTGNKSTSSNPGGGAISVNGVIGAGGFTVRNSTFSGNISANSGGAFQFRNFDGAASIQNSTLVGNSAATLGGGIRRTSSAGNFGTGVITLESTIVSGNSGSAGSEDLSDTSSKVVNVLTSALGVGTGFTFGTNAGNLIGQNLKLGSLAFNGGTIKTILPAADSPLKDAGSNPAGAATDARGPGYPRVMNIVADIGAVEIASFVVRNTNDAGKDSLRQQIVDANAFAGADTVTFDGAVFSTAKTITLTTGQLAITSAMTITGPGAALATVSGNNASRVMNIDDGVGSAAAVTISGLTLTAGSTAGDGGGILSVENLTLNGAVVSNSKANGNAGGIENSTGTITIIDSTIRGNIGNFDKNTSGDGGGLHNTGVATITGSTFSDNAIYTAGSNTNGNGGGIWSNVGLLITNSTIAQNSADREGGGVWASGTGTLTHVTIVDNLSDADANGQGSGGGYTDVNGGDTFTNCLVVYNTTKDLATNNNFGGSALNAASKNNLVGVGLAGGLTNGVNGNIVGVADAKVGVLASNGGPTQTVTPAYDSPAINAASATALTLDQRGIARVNGSAADIGAMELNTIVTNTLDTGVGSLRNAVAEANRVADSNVITFDASFQTSKTITLTSGELAFTAGGAFIVGPGADKLTISGNNSSRIFNTSAGDPVDFFAFLNMTLTNGKAASGGAIQIGDEIVQLERMAILNSTATGGGGGLSGGGGVQASGGGSLFVATSLLAGNAATNSTVGGAIFVSNTDLIIANSTISGNSGANNGGGIYAFDSEFLNLYNCTITANTAYDTGGVAANFVLNFVVQSSVVAGNSGRQLNNSGGNALDVFNSAIGSTAGWTLNTGSGNLAPGTDLKLGALADNGGPTFTHSPALDSPLRGSGNNSQNQPVDQRGLPRTDGVGNTDIGAVQVFTTTVVSIVRANANPTSAASVNWTVTVTDAVTGLDASNFTLTGPGAAGASITGVSGSGTSYTVSVNTGGEGTLGLTFSSTAGLDVLPSNAPFVGQSYFVNKLALAVTGITSNIFTVNDNQVGPGKFSLTATYSEAMDTSVTPSFSFPTSGEDPTGVLILSSSSWTSPTTFTAVYNVNDLNANIPSLDVRVSGGKDTGGNAFGTFTEADLFTIDTRNPFATSILRTSASPTKASSVSWTVNFSEVITGLSLSNFGLFNGGLSGTPALTGVSGSGTTYTVSASTGSGEGTLALYLDNGLGANDGVGNFLAGTPVVGGSYGIDHVSPRPASFSTSAIVINDAIVGPNSFTATLKYQEQMNTNVQPVVSFPVEPVVGTLSFASGTWLNAYTWQAKFNVADAGLELNAIDLRIDGGVDLVGNPQEVFNAVDLLRIDTLNPVSTKISSTTPDGTYGVGANVNITLTFNEPVTLAGGNLLVTLDTGAVVTVAPFSGTSAGGTYTVAAGQSSPDLTVTALALASGATLKDGATNVAVLSLPSSNLANNAALMIASPASVTGFVVNDGVDQRSRLTKVAVSFSGSVNAATLAAAGGLTFTRTGGGPAVTIDATSGVILSATSGFVTGVDITFANALLTGIDYASLADGRWQLAIPSLSYTSPLGDPQLHRLFGDFNGDATVDGGQDFANLKFLTAVGNPFDFNNDGVVDGPTDFAEFGTRFGKTV